MVRLTDRPDMTFDVYRGRKTTKQQQKNCNESTALGRPVIIPGGLSRYNGAPTFTLIFRRGLHNLFGCSACIEVS